MRRRYQLAITAAAAVAGTIGWRWGQQPPPPPRSSSRQAVSLGPVPLALPDEPSPPAHLTGRIQSIEPEWEQGNDALPAVVPPSLPNDASIDEPGWRPSARTEEKAEVEVTSGGHSGHTQVATYRTPAAVAKAPASPPTESGRSPPPAFKTVLHRITDGDTLASVAARYLGSASRWPEVFAANRDRLSNPEVLPINTELRIVVPASGQEQAGGR